MYSDKASKALQRARQFIDRGNPSQALFDLEKIVRKYPAGFDAWFLLGHAKGLLNDHSGAEACFKRAANLQPRNPDIWFNLGIGYSARNLHREAIPCFEKSLEYSGKQRKESVLNLASCRIALEEYDSAISLLKELLQSFDTAEVHANLGIAYQGQENFPEAISAYLHARAMGMNTYTINLNMGTCYFSLSDFDASVEFAESALALKPGDAIAEYNVARSLLERGEILRSINAFKSCALNAADHARLFACNFLEPYDPQRLLDEHREWANRLDAGISFLTEDESSQGTRQLRLGFVSADLRSHPVAFFLEQLLVHLDHSRFAVNIFSDVRTADEVTLRFKRLADVWTDIAEVSDQAMVARVIADQRIDILFDLGGHTSERINLFVHRVAPVQATYLGYSATTGLPNMDYFVTDSVLDPPGLTETHYVEKLCRLGNSFASYTPPQHEVTIGPVPMLVREYPVFGSFHKLTKISARTIKLWSGALTAVPNARMLIVAKGLGTDTGKQRMRTLFESQGIDSGRLDLRGNIPFKEYFAAHNEIDLLLDCVPWNSHTTAMHGIWMGVPTLTVQGGHHTGRFGELVLRGMGLGDFISASDDEFATRAADIVANAARLQQIRETARKTLTDSVLCDHVAMAERFDQACMQMWDNHLRGAIADINA
jgi:predicted O-linked N-acetylglucosamine transferase (SPINDLY family)